MPIRPSPMLCRRSITKSTKISCHVGLLEVLTLDGAEESFRPRLARHRTARLGQCFSTPVDGRDNTAGEFNVGLVACGASGHRSFLSIPSTIGARGTPAPTLSDLHDGDWRTMAG